jgi:signal transduction histidine kinase
MGAATALEGEGMPAETPETARILIVDDEPANVRLLENVLRQFDYKHLLSTTESRRAVTLFREFHPDLVLLDLRMPAPDGFEILDQLQRLIPSGGYLPVLVTTADVSPDTLRRALQAGAKDFLTNPFDVQTVILRVRNLLETRVLHLALQEQNRVLDERVQERTRQLLQLEKLSAMGQLLAGVAHELNNPLAVVFGQAQLLLTAAGGSPHAPRAEKIATAAARCVRIVQNFLALARDRPPARTRVDLNAVVREAVDLLAYELHTDGVEISWALAPDLPSLSADPHQLHQVVLNLITNAHQAMRATPPPRSLAVATRTTADRRGVQLTVTDSGPGIPPEIQSRIFDPFFTTKPIGQGTGLGLSFSFGIITDHGGTIRVESEPGQGARFTIELPVAAPASDEVSAPESRPVATLAPQRILVVDDEPDVAGVLSELLESDGHTVDTARNGKEALERIAQRPYDVILSDTKMPTLDGEGLFRELERRHPALRRRLAFITGDVLNETKRAFLERMGTPVLSKPFELNDIRDVVRRLAVAREVD